jgi:hypothetical protein
VSMRDKGRFDGDGDNDGELVGGDPGWCTKEPSSLASPIFPVPFLSPFLFSFPCLSRTFFPFFLLISIDLILLSPCWFHADRWFWLRCRNTAWISIHSMVYRNSKNYLKFERMSLFFVKLLKSITLLPSVHSAHKSGLTTLFPWPSFLPSCSAITLSFSFHRDYHSPLSTPRWLTSTFIYFPSPRIPPSLTYKIITLFIILMNFKCCKVKFSYVASS